MWLDRDAACRSVIWKSDGHSGYGQISRAKHIGEAETNVRRVKSYVEGLADCRVLENPSRSILRTSY